MQILRKILKKFLKLWHSEVPARKTGFLKLSISRNRIYILTRAHNHTLSRIRNQTRTHIHAHLHLFSYLYFQLGLHSSTHSYSYSLVVTVLLIYSVGLSILTQNNIIAHTLTQTHAQTHTNDTHWFSRSYSYLFGICCHSDLPWKSFSHRYSYSIEDFFPKTKSYFSHSDFANSEAPKLKAAQNKLVVYARSGGVKPLNF